ncbi:DUF488 domain-containing protein [Kocuria sp. ZOR0020]|uniref:DUF488 domain-containing protein n=1 Tax=Kocuria sp. ZOR0020 TaxID=1339234 RepID=UPI0006467640|nr:DUF488 family protein [Kocuria sp. ZOR0020]
MTEIVIKRVREEPQEQDGVRILVDRLWPRGLSKAKADVGCRVPEAAPSPELRKWFNHEPAKWEEFVERYRAELEENSAAAELGAQIERHPKVTLLYDAKDTKHNHALILRDWLAYQAG